MSLPALLLTLLAAACGYLASPHRHWQVGTVRFWRWAAVLLMSAGLAAWIAALGPVGGVFACVTTLMLGWMVTPWLGLWRPTLSFPRRREAMDVGPRKATSMDSRLRGNDEQKQKRATEVAG